MIADIVAVLMVVAFCAWGAIQGFMRGILGFVTTAVVVVLSLLAAHPIMLLINRLTDESIDRAWRLAIHVMIATAVFIAIKLVIWILRQKATKMRGRNRMVSRIDRFLGSLLGLFRFALVSCVFAVFVVVLDGLLGGVQGFLFGGSVIAVWVYDRTLDIVWPLVDAVASTVFGALR